MHAGTFSPTRWPLAVMLTVALAALVGCEQTGTPLDGTEPDAGAQSENVNDPMGGFNTASEAVNFGDEFLMSEDAERDVTDDMESDEAVVGMMDRPNVDLYGVRLTWGNLARDEVQPGDGLIDWSGGVSLERGAVLIRRTILFEPIQGDHIVRPRESRLVLEWESVTRGGLDGVQLVVVDPQPAEDDSTGDEPRVEENMLTISTPLFTETITVALLDGLDRTVDVDDAGNQIRIQARKIDLHDDAPCRHGWLAGKWERLVVDEPGDTTGGDLPDGVVGRFRGHWVTASGHAGGAIRGFYGINDEGHRVLFGKMITRNGRFEAYVRGVWEPADDRPGMGSFRARILTEDRDAIGGLRGVYGHREDGRGLFHGGWGIGCEDDEVEVDDSIF